MKTTDKVRQLAERRIALARRQCAARLSRIKKKHQAAVAKLNGRVRFLSAEVGRTAVAARSKGFHEGSAASLRRVYSHLDPVAVVWVGQCLMGPAVRPPASVEAQIVALAKKLRISR